MPKSYNISPEYYDKLCIELAKVYYGGMLDDEETITILRKGGYIDNEIDEESK